MMGLIKEEIVLKKEYRKISSEIVAALHKEQLLSKRKIVIGICGESGSGKSITALGLQLELENNGVSSAILHQDCYYKLTPKENHKKRKADINWVGIQELRLDLIQNHIEQFRSGEDQVLVPVVDYRKNVFTEEFLTLENIQVLIVEGVYAFYVEDLDHKIFLDRTYHDTIVDRKSRTRETYDPFVEDVLSIEHRLVTAKRDQADLVITKDYQLVE